MASPSNVVFLLAVCFVVASRAGIIRRSVENADLSKLQINENDPAQVHSALANHTAAVVELVLQNLHRLKNYQARERLERLVTRFKTLVDELDAQQIHNDFNKADQAKSVDDSVAPSIELNRNSVPAEDSFQNEIPHSHRGQLSLTLLPNKEQPKRVEPASRQIEGMRAENSVKSSKSVLAPAPTVFVFHDDSVTTTVSTESDNEVATSEVPPQLPLPKANTEAVLPRAPETKADDAVDDDESEGNEDDDDDDELVSELHQEGFHEEQGIEAAGTAGRNDFYQPMREEDQLIEVNSHRYDPSTNHADARAFANTREWNPSLTSGSEETEDEEADNETDNGGGDDVESNKTERIQYPRQLDEDVKLLNKVISNLRQVKNILERMRFNEGSRRRR